MRIAIVGATGNVGTSVIDALGRDDSVESIVGIARRVPAVRLPKVEWRPADVTRDDLGPALEGADCVIHLAWLIQPGRDQALLDAANVEGSARVFHAAADAGVRSLVYASSVGAYSPGPKDRRVDESWPTDGIPTAYYARQKAAVERLLDRFEREVPDIRVVRLRPALIFKREAASEIRRLFVGPLLPSPLLRRGLIPVVPRVDRLAFQAVHSHDVGEAYRLAAVGDARGAFNIAADPVLDSAALATALGARKLPLPAGALRAAASLSWRLRLQPTEPGWIDMARAVPLMSSERARVELGWAPRHGADDALLELLDGIRERAAFPTPPLARRAGGSLRAGELATGVGSRV
jgi:UDP-glucose 4-epimerase